jgi:hypothetical protein
MFAFKLPLTRWEGDGGRGKHEVITNTFHPHPDPPSSRGREKLSCQLVKIFKKRHTGEVFPN